eukprot:g2081.t1
MNVESRHDLPCRQDAEVTFLQVDVSQVDDGLALPKHHRWLPHEYLWALLQEVTIQRLRSFLLFCMVLVIAQLFTILWHTKRAAKGPPTPPPSTAPVGARRRVDRYRSGELHTMREP